MPEANQIKYDLKEIAALMLRDQGIRSGLWMIWTRFGHAVANIAPPPDAPPGGATGPGVISILTEVGIQKVEEPGPLSVDASQVWKEERAKPKRRRATSKSGGGSKA